MAENCIDLKIQYFTDFSNILFRNNFPAKLKKTYVSMFCATHKIQSQSDKTCFIVFLYCDLKF